MPVSRKVARFNRTVANRIVGPLFTRLPGFGTIHHRGRKSGRAFRTPVKLFRLGEEYVVTLPYGPTSDWVRNVLAAGGCEVTTRGRRIRLVAPRLFTDDGRTPMPALTRRLLARVDATDFLALSVAVPSAAPRAVRGQRGR
ncbi:nitroreductase family deazaflavin-dependent oxidoreductase [Streptomyces aculeolatus]|jgi:deazaflavin-dependent oxidoreductase (nitroreductase family)